MTSLKVENGATTFFVQFIRWFYTETESLNVKSLIILTVDEVQVKRKCISLFEHMFHFVSTSNNSAEIQPVFFK